MTPPQPNYVLIDDDEKKKLFAPTQQGDEIHFDGNPQRHQWFPITGQHIGCSFGTSTYRRLARNAWLKISEKPVQYPAWVLHQNGLCKWFARDPNNEVTKMCWTHWLPAPNPPEAPSNDPLSDTEKLIAFDFFISGWKEGADAKGLLADAIAHAKREILKSK